MDDGVAEQTGEPSAGREDRLLDRSDGVTAPSLSPLPQVFDVAFHLARLYRLEQIVTFGYAPTWLPGTARRIGLVRVRRGAETRRCQPRYPVDEEWTWNDTRGDPLPIAPAGLTRSVLVCHGAVEVADKPFGYLRGIASEVSTVPVALLTLPSDPGANGRSRTAGHLECFEAELREAGLPPTFIGWTSTASTTGHGTAALAIVDRAVGAGPSIAPEDFSVVAIVTTYNESDVIAGTIETLIEDGVSVYVIDNWSTDGTAEIARRYVGNGVVRVERFPEAPSEVYDWTSLLRRVEKVAASVEADWVIHHDADERRTPPWPGTTLRDGLWTADRSGFNAVDHTVLNFRPIDNGFVPGTRPEGYFRNFQFGSTPDLLLQIKAWKRLPGLRVDLVTSGGHEASFPGRRVFPYKFVLKHYPIRSQAHGEEKIFRHRVARWNPTERNIGWHTQYDGVTHGASLLVDPALTAVFVSPDGYRTFLPEIVAGAGLAPGRAPAGRSGRVARLVYAVTARALARSGVEERTVRGLWRLPSPVRKRVFGAKRRLLG